MAHLVLGPLLRYVAETEATVWVETDSACEVDVLGHRARTFLVAGHHYAIVSVGGLAAGATQPYQVVLDGERRWPEAGFPPSEIRTLQRGQELSLAFGSCRVSAPDRPPHSPSLDEDERQLGVDALDALGLRMRAGPRAPRPDLLLLLGDQVYADELSPGVARFIRERRDVQQPPGEEVADFEEYTQLYREAWSNQPLRWLLSTLSTAMIFDDHDLHDDWNTSETWVNQMRAKGWWQERIVGAFMSYWIYQHLGNLSPRQLAEDPLFRQVTHSEDGGPALRAFALRASHETGGSRWSYSRTIGTSRLVVIDSRAGRVVKGGRRSMLDEREWEWLERQVTGNVDHLLLASSVPLLLAPGLHHLEAWNEAVCAGAWGGKAAKLAEDLRQRLDLEHWAAFQESFIRLARMIRAVASGERGTAPASIVVLSGDVHHAYLAEAWFRHHAGVKSQVYQAVCSPFRNQLAAREQRAVRTAISKPATVAARGLALAAGVRQSEIRWRLVQEPSFENQIATITIRGREAQLTIEKTRSDRLDPALDVVLQRRLA